MCHPLPHGAGGYAGWPSFVDEEAGRLIDADDALADLRAKPSDQDEKQ